MEVNLLYYRPWRGRFHAPAFSIWPIARVGLGLLFRRKLFWALYACGLLIFLMFFFGQFLLEWAITVTESSPLQAGAARRWVVQLQRGLSFLSGNQDTFRYFFSYQGTMLVVILTLAGAILVGNDFAFGSVPFYLAKPVSRWHYVLGKCLAVGVIINLMTTLPAVLLYVQFGFSNWEYFIDPDYFRHDRPSAGPAGLPLLLGILGYGLVLTVALSLMLVATAGWLRRTMPMIMVWIGVFLFLPLLARILGDVFHNADWLLLDLWNDLCLVGNALLGIHQGTRGGAQPELAAAVLVLGGVCVACLTYLNRRTRVVEIVR
jgi:hypothetical protein